MTKKARADWIDPRIAELEAIVRQREGQIQEGEANAAKLRVDMPPKDGFHYAWVEGIGWCEGEQHEHARIAELEAALRERVFKPNVEDCTDPWECCVHTPEEYRAALEEKEE